MVTGLQLPLQNFFADESAASKSPSRESETIQGLTFGSILRAKEKQLQDAQTVSASSIAAAVAAWQAVPVAKLTGEATSSQDLAEARSVDSEGIEKTQATASLPEKIMDREPRVTAAQPQSPKEVPIFQRAQPGAKLTSRREASQPEAVTLASPATDANQIIKTTPGAELPPAKIKISSQTPASLGSDTGKGKRATAAPVFSREMEPVPHASDRWLDGRPATPPPAGIETNQTVSAGKLPAVIRPSKPEPFAGLQQRMEEVIIPADVSPELNHIAIPVPAVAEPAGTAEGVAGDRTVQATSQPAAQSGGSVQPATEAITAVVSLASDPSESERRQAFVPTQGPLAPEKQGNVRDKSTPFIERLQPEKVWIPAETPAFGAFSSIDDENSPRMQPVALTGAPVRLQNHIEPPATDTSLAEAVSVQRTAQDSSTSRVVQAAMPGQEALVAGEVSSLVGGDATESGLQQVEFNSKREVRTVASEISGASSQPEPANLADKVEGAAKPAAPLQSTGQDSVQPVPTAQDSVKEARRVSVVGNATEPEEVNGKSAPKRPETMPALEGAASQAPQPRGNSVESVAGQGGGTGAKFPATEVIQQIAHHVEARVRERSTEMRLQLNPKELGIIEVQMVSGPQGVSVTFSAEQPATGRLLETQLNQLHQALTEAGVQVAGLNIGQHSQPRQEGGFLQQNQPFIHFSQPDDLPQGANVQEPRRPLRGSGRPGEVDYLI